MTNKIILFKAIAYKSNREPYNASFQISWPIVENPSYDLIQSVVNIAVSQFYEYHPNGRIIQHMEITK